MKSPALLWTLVLAAALWVTPVCSFSSQNRVFVSTPVSNHPKKLVSDCMTPAPTCLTPSMSIDDTIIMLLNNGLSGAPVVNEDGEPVGVLTASDFLEKEAFEGSLLPMGGSSEVVQMYAQAAKKICGQKVADVMTSEPVTVELGLPMRDAAKLMAEKKLNRLPVVDTNNKLVGILSSGDVMRDLLQIARELPPAHEDDDATDGAVSP